MRIDPPIPANTYHDSFGNFCHAIRAPAGRLTLSTDFLVQDSGEPDAVVRRTRWQHPLDELPVDALVFLLGSRYCETDRLSDYRLVGCSATCRTAGRWCRRSATSRTSTSSSATSTRARPRRRSRPITEQHGVCRDYAHLAIALCRCMNIPARYCTGYLGDIGTEPPNGADGLRGLVRGLSRRRLVHLRSAQQRAAHRPHPDGARARRDRRRDEHLLRPVQRWRASRCVPTR